MEATTKPAVLNTDAARAYLGGLSRTSLWRLQQSGSIQGVLVAGRRMYLTASLDAYLERQLEAEVTR